MRLEPGTRLGEYEILGFLDAGGMGEVYRARDPRIGRDVAIKVLPASFATDPLRVQRFQQEARAAGVLNHPNLLTIYELGTHDGSPFIVSELLDGGTLRSRLSGPLSQQRAIGYAIQIANGLAAAHAKGILHRDLKPENIFVTTDERVKILDFGLAKLTHPESDVNTVPRTGTGVVAGTPGYMSPEQVRGAFADARSDIFSLGTILYEMLSGHPPFRAGSSVETMNAVLTSDPPPPQNASGSLQRIVSHCLEKSPEARVQSARDLAFELETISDLTERPTTRPIRAAWIVGLLVLGVLIAAGVWKLRTPRAGGAVPSSIDSLAVLPFANATNDSKNEYLSDGVTESIINSMSQLPQLKVMSRSTMFRFKGKNVDPQEVGRQLKVSAVVAGRVAQLADRLTVQAELVNVSDGAQLWGEQYNRQVSDIFAIEEEIARDISQKLRLKLTGQQERRLTKRFTSDTKAYQLYLKGRYSWNRRTATDLEAALRYFQEAIDRDPNYALAYVGLADTYAVLPEYADVSDKEAREKAKAAATKALELDEELGEAHATLGLLSDSDWRWDDAEEHFRRAIELTPNYATAYHWYALHLVTVGRFAEGKTMIERAAAVDPLSMIVRVNVRIAEWYAGKKQEAYDGFRNDLRSDPNYASIHKYLGRFLVADGKRSEGLQEIIKADTLLGGRSADARAPLAYAYAVNGDRRKAQSIASELEARARAKRCPPFNVAMAYAGFDEDSAVRWLRRGIVERDSFLQYITVSPEFDHIIRSPVGAEVLRAVGLPPHV